MLNGGFVRKIVWSWAITDCRQPAPLAIEAARSRALRVLATASSLYRSRSTGGISMILLNFEESDNWGIDICYSRCNIATDE